MALGLIFFLGVTAALIGLVGDIRSMPAIQQLGKPRCRDRIDLWIERMDR
jgi:hypothetical protein